jgi:hypothetical protein
LLGVCRVLTPEVTCVPSQLVQLLVFFIFGLRARGNRDTLIVHVKIQWDLKMHSVCSEVLWVQGNSSVIHSGLDKACEAKLEEEETKLGFMGNRQSTK